MFMHQSYENMFLFVKGLGHGYTQEFFSKLFEPILYMSYDNVGQKYPPKPL